MKTLTLVDGTTFSVLDDSSSANIRIPVESFADADEIKTKFTRENMTEIEIGNEIANQVNPLSVSVNETDDGLICSIFCQSSLQDYVQNQIDNYTEWLIDEGVI